MTGKNKKKYKMTKDRYYYGHIILKNNIFDKRFLRKEVIQIKNKMLQISVHNEEIKNSK